MSSPAARVWAAAAGVVLGGWTNPSLGWIVILSAVLCGCALARRRPLLLPVALVCAGVACGAFAMELRAREGRALETLARRVPRCHFHGRVLEGAGRLGTLLAVEHAECAAAGRGRSLGPVIAPEIDAASGAPFRASGWLVPLGSDTFDRARRATGARALLDADVFHAGSPTGWFGFAERMRAGLTRATGILPARHAALVSGMALGDTHGMDAEDVEAYRTSGLSHLVAVSGSNVAIVVGGIAALTSWASRRLRITATLVSLAFYVTVVGPDPSVVRAAAMGGIAIVSVVIGTRVDPRVALGLAVVVALSFRPTLVGAAGLQLSVTATAGIILWAAPIADRLSRLPRPLALVVGVTLAAQVAVAPVSALIFGQISLVGPVANVVVAAAVAPATIAGVLAAAAGTVSATAGHMAALAAEPFAAWVAGIGLAAARVPYASLQVGRPVAWALAAATAAVAIGTARDTRGRYSPSGARHQVVDPRRLRRADQLDRSLRLPRGG